MTTEPIQPIVQIMPINYPYSILLGTKPYPMKFNISNLSNENKEFFIEIIPEGFEFKSDINLKKGIKLKPNETKDFELEIKPTRNGQIKIIINTYMIKTIKYTEKEFKIKESVDERIIKSILNTNYLDLPELQIEEEIEEEPSIEEVKEVYMLEEAEEKFNELLSLKEKILQEYQTNQGDIELQSESGEETEGNIENNEIDTQEKTNEVNDGKISNSRSLEELTEELDNSLKELALGISSFDIGFAINIAAQITNNKLKKPLLENLILIYSKINIQDAINTITNLIVYDEQEDLIKSIIKLNIKTNTEFCYELLDKITDDEFKKNYLQKIAYYLIINKSPRFIEIIPSLDEELLQKLLPYFINYYYKIDVAKSFDLSKKITNKEILPALYFEIAKFLYSLDKNTFSNFINEVINSIFNLYTDSSDLYLKLKDSINYKILKSSIILIGAANGVEYTVEYIKYLEKELSEALNKELFNYFWETYEVEKEKTEKPQINSIYYSFNAAINPSKPLEMVYELGGNISENLLTGDLSSFIGIICPFTFNFPIFPAIEQAYSSIKMEKNKSFYYLIIPTKFKTEQEFIFIQTLLYMWFVANEHKFQSKVFLFNLDFIPYLTKPTIIIESNPEENLFIQTIISKTFGDSVSLIIDDGLFKGGMIKKIFQKILPKDKFKVINVVMTYDFLNNYELLKNFMNAFIK